MADPILNTWKVADTISENVTREQFLKAIDIWNTNPRSVNQRIHSSIVVLHESVSGRIDTIDLSLKLASLKSEVSAYDANQFQDVLRTLGLNFSLDETSSSEVYLKKLLPKSNKHFSVSFELVIIDRDNGWAYFSGFPLQVGLGLLPKFPYRLTHGGFVSLEVLTDQDECDPSLVWLKKQLLPQLYKWTCSHHERDEAEASDTCLPKASHTLISTEKYAHLYQDLKNKYGQQMVKIWPECTDPAKYVYEDVAIAAYLLLLWGDEKPVSYVDLGCGNGLLVHILNSEGHTGIGIDVRSRKIWKLYPATTTLEVRSITPSDSSLFPEAQWLIGNHSDELTPWIPVMAARSSQTCKFFVLPCCPYDFDGLKFRRKNSSLSQYADFLMYVKELSDKCGFNTNIDRMRIPSTKRICLVGQSRKYTPDEWTSVNTTINKLIEDGCRKISESAKKLSEELSGQNEWVSNFKPREASEKVRNCTQLEEALVGEIVSLTARHLLAKRRIITHPNQQNKTWNAGGIAALGEIIPLVGSEKLKQLKSECGGLQTLLKNHHQVFRVEKGQVRLRTPIHINDAVKNDKTRLKFKPCWFFYNHPDGCLLEDVECAFKH